MRAPCQVELGRPKTGTGLIGRNGAANEQCGSTAATSRAGSRPTLPGRAAIITGASRGIGARASLRCCWRGRRAGRTRRSRRCRPLPKSPRPAASHSTTQLVAARPRRRSRTCRSTTTTALSRSRSGASSCGARRPIARSLDAAFDATRMRPRAQTEVQNVAPGRHSIHLPAGGPNCLFAGNFTWSPSLAERPGQDSNLRPAA
jgi:hypothetical protein